MTKKEFKEIRIALTNNPIETLYHHLLGQVNELHKILMTCEYREFLMSNTIEEAMERTEKLDEMFDKVLIMNFGCIYAADSDDPDDKVTTDYDHLKDFVKSMTDAQEMLKKLKDKEFKLNWAYFEGDYEKSLLRKKLYDEKLAKQSKTK
jgi:hypothetical protein